MYVINWLSPDTEPVLWVPNIPARDECSSVKTPFLLEKNATSSTAVNYVLQVYQHPCLSRGSSAIYHKIDNNVKIPLRWVVLEGAAGIGEQKMFLSSFTVVILEKTKGNTKLRGTKLCEEESLHRACKRHSI